MIGSVRRAVHVLAALALGAGAFVALGAPPASAADPLGYVVVQGEGECWLASVDLVTGETTQIGTPSAEKCAFDLEFTPDGKRLVGTRVVESGDGDIAIIVEFDLTTGAVTTLSQLGDFSVGGPGEEQGNVTFGPDQELYTYLVPGLLLPPPIDEEAVDPACDGSAFCLFHVDHENPTVVTYINSVPQTFTVYEGLATSCAGVTSSIRDFPRDDAASLPLGARWDAAVAADTSQFLTRVNLTATGPGTTDVGPIPDVQLSSLDYDTAGTLFAVGFVTEEAGPSLLTLDPSTGAPTTVAPLNNGDTRLNVGVLGFAIPHPCAPAPPPEPPAAQPIAAVTPRFTG